MRYRIILAAALAACAQPGRGPTAPAAPPCACPAPANAPPSTAPPLTAPPPAGQLTAKQALRDLRILERAVTDLHPGLYRYLTPAAWAAELAWARGQVAAGVDRGQMYRIVSHIGAAIRCGHTWTNPLNQRADVRDEVLGAADKLPVEVRLIEDRLLVTGSATAAVVAGTELAAVDGVPPAAMVAELLPYLRADGSNDGKRRAQLDHGEDGGALDLLWPLLHPPVDGHYRLSVVDATGRRDVVVPATTAAARTAAIAAAGGAPSPPADWTFTIDGDTAVLTLPTFAFWNSDFDWRGFLAQTFATLAARRVPYLVIDQRRNEGGDGAIVDALVGYLIDRPLTTPPVQAEVAFERAPYDLARFLDTWDWSFFDRTGHVTRGAGRNLVDTAASSPGDTITPAPDRYAGRTFVLIGPDNSSAGFVLAARLKQAGAATLVGRTTGGNRRGINGGQLTWVTLPESGVALDIPLIAWMPRTAAPDAGIEPDLAVPASFDDAAAGRDLDLAAARAAIAGLRRAGASARAP
ncbi:MAG: S41 family peptidase [Kofleriaceae bacterium]